MQHGPIELQVHNKKELHLKVPCLRAARQPITQKEKIQSYQNRNWKSKQAEPFADKDTRKAKNAKFRRWGSCVVHPELYANRKH